MEGRTLKELRIWHKAIRSTTAGTDHIESSGRGDGQRDKTRGTAVATAKAESARSMNGSDISENRPHMNMNAKDRYRRGNMDDLTSTYPEFL